MGNCEDGNRTSSREDGGRQPWWSDQHARTIVVNTRFASSVVEAVCMPTIVVAVVVVHTHCSRLAIPGRLSAAAMIGSIDAERGNQQQQHGGYCDLPVCSCRFEHRSES